MKSRARLLGHPLHPILITLPLGLLAGAVVVDLVHWVSGDGFWGRMSYWMTAGGIVTGLLAAVAGFIDWWAIPRGTRARQIGTLHAIVNVAVLALFAISWWVRRPDPALLRVPAVLLDIVAFGLAGVSGWLGGELIYRLGVAVDPGANLDAPSSLSTDEAGHPAAATGARPE